MKRSSIIAYGTVAYAVFLAAFLYAIGFVGNIWVPRSVDHAIPASVPEALVVNTLLLSTFAIQHSVMARPWFKRWWTRFVPHPIERSTFVLIASSVLFLLYWQWRTMPAIVWEVTSPAARVAVWVVFWAGWMTVLATTFMINHFDLFGLRQVYLAWRGKPYTDLTFRVVLLYGLVRHPLYLGFLVAFWATPTMTTGHLLFALGCTGYILIAIRFEERDLIAALGAQYREYRERVPMLIPRPRRVSP